MWRDGALSSPPFLQPVLVCGALLVPHFLSLGGSWEGRAAGDEEGKGEGVAQPLSGLEAHWRGWVWGSLSRDSREKALQPHEAVLGPILPLAKPRRKSQRSSEWAKGGKSQKSGGHWAY